jgi:hypothetical protein
MNVLALWKSHNANQIGELKETIAKLDAENDELRELLEERDKERDYLLEQKVHSMATMAETYERKLKLKECELVHCNKILAEAFSLLDATHARLKAGCKHDPNESQ